MDDAKRRGPLRAVGDAIRVTDDDRGHTIRAHPSPSLMRMALLGRRVSAPRRFFASVRSHRAGCAFAPPVANAPVPRDSKQVP